MKLTIYRQYLPEGCFGELWGDGERICYTTERAWNFNRSFTSCIPEGNYTIRRCTVEKFGDCWIVNGTGHRTGILIHIANLPSELQGCIAPSLARGIYKGQYAGLSSGKAMDKLYDMLGDGEHELVIKGGMPGA